MSELQVSISEGNTLEFDVDIKGIQPTSVDARFVIENGSMVLMFPGTLNENTISVSIPSLAKILEAKTYTCRLEMILEGSRFFTPLESDIELIEPITVTSVPKTQTQKKQEPVVETTSVKVTPRKPAPKKVDPNAVKSIAERLQFGKKK